MDVLLSSCRSISALVDKDSALRYKKQDIVKNKPVFVTATILAIFLVIACLPSALSSEITTCVQCHTSDRILKSLYKPPQVDTSEGEG